MFKTKLIPYSVPELELRIFFSLVSEIIVKGIGCGEEVEELEKKFVRYIKTNYAIAFPSCRYAMFLVYNYYCKDKKVVLPSYTCIPVMDAARFANVKPYFLDIELNSYNPKFDKSLTKKKIGGITLSYLYGLIGELDEFLDLAKEKNIPIIEDAAIAIGGEYKRKKVGNLGDAGIFSLQSSKILTGWRGGIVTTNDEKLYSFLLEEKEKLKKPKYVNTNLNIFMTYFRSLMNSPNIYGFTMYPLKYLITSETFGDRFGKIIGHNPREAIIGDGEEKQQEEYRLTDVQAFIVNKSFDKIDKIIETRRKNAKFLHDNLKDYVIVPKEKNVKHSYGRFPIRIKGKNKFELQKYFLNKGVEIGLNYPYIIPNTKFIRRYNLKKEDYPNSLIASKETILLPFHTFLKKEDLKYIIDMVRDYVKLNNTSI